MTFLVLPAYDVLTSVLAYNVSMKKMSHGRNKQEGSFFDSQERASKILKARDLLYSVGRGSNSRVTARIKNSSSSDIKMTRLNPELTSSLDGIDSTRQIGSIGANSLSPAYNINLSPNEGSGCRVHNWQRAFNYL